MSNQGVKDIDERLGQLLKVELTVPPSTDVNEALRVADSMESRGFSFQLRDMAPKSLYDSQWRATFTFGEMAFSAEDSRSAVAICLAAATALTGQTES